ncbi:MAG: hypothetical protein PHH83_02295, partial [Patescibacteria group bacterium]|nr:hypothetical protein [Patescibacteria group bacterium]
MTRKKQNFLSKLYLLLFWTKEVKSNKDRCLFAHLWQNTWLDQEYATEATIPELIKHYQKYDESSKDFILYFLGKAIGTVRLVLGRNLPVTADFEIDDSQYKDIANMEVTLMTLDRKFQRRSEEH